MGFICICLCFSPLTSYMVSYLPKRTLNHNTQMYVTHHAAWMAGVLILVNYLLFIIFLNFSFNDVAFVVITYTSLGIHRSQNPDRNISDRHSWQPGNHKFGSYYGYPNHIYLCRQGVHMNHIQTNRSISRQLQHKYISIRKSVWRRLIPGFKRLRHSSSIGPFRYI